MQLLLGRVAHHLRCWQPQLGLLQAAVHQGPGQLSAPRQVHPPQASRCRSRPCTAATRQHGFRASRPPTLHSPACCAACPWPWLAPRRRPRPLTPALHQQALLRRRAPRQRQHRPPQRSCPLLPRRHAQSQRQAPTGGALGSAGRPRRRAAPAASRPRAWCAAGASRAAPTACSAALYRYEPLAPAAPDPTLAQAPVVELLVHKTGSFPMRIPAPWDGQVPDLAEARLQI